MCSLVAMDGAASILLQRLKTSNVFLSDVFESGHNSFQNFLLCERQLLIPSLIPCYLTLINYTTFLKRAKFSF